MKSPRKFDINILDLPISPVSCSNFLLGHLKSFLSYYLFQNMKIMGGAAAWAEWAMAHPKFWLGGPQCIWPHQ